jgi:hypothetical protein
MVSAVERPCLLLLAMYSRVRESQARRTSTTRHRALLACRSPPRSSRWRTGGEQAAELVDHGGDVYLAVAVDPDGDQALC